MIHSSRKGEQARFWGVLGSRGHNLLTDRSVRKDFRAVL